MTYELPASRQAKVARARSLTGLERGERDFAKYDGQKTRRPPHFDPTAMKDAFRLDRSTTAKMCVFSTHHCPGVMLRVIIAVTGDASRHIRELERKAIIAVNAWCSDAETIYDVLEYN